MNLFEFNETPEIPMAAITINDLAVSRELDRDAMASIRGAGAGWVFGWIRPFVEAAPSFGQVFNFYQTNNIFVADQMNNQIAVIDVNNSAANATINVDARQLAGNFKQ
jgi:hypothetical protein